MTILFTGSDMEMRNILSRNEPSLRHTTRVLYPPAAPIDAV